MRNKEKRKGVIEMTETGDRVNAVQIAQKNDLFRTSFGAGAKGKVVFTPGVSSLDQVAQSKVVEAVQKFKNFEPGNDPYGERDFGKVSVDGVDYFFKIDYYDASYEYGLDGNDPEVRRVLTVMRADEY